MPVDVKYTTSATATGGRDGRSKTKDGALDVKLARPKELGGSGGPGNNPEQLFAAGYAACFLGAMKHVAAQDGPKIPDDATVTATVGIGPRSEGGFGLDIGLDVAMPWSRRRTRSVPTRTRRAATCRCACASSERGARRSEAVQRKARPVRPTHPPVQG